MRKTAATALLGIEPKRHIVPLASLLLNEAEPIGLREQDLLDLADAARRLRDGRVALLEQPDSRTELQARAAGSASDIALALWGRLPRRSVAAEQLRSAAAPR